MKWRKRRWLLAAAAGLALAPVVLGRRGWLGFLLSNALVVVPSVWRNGSGFGPVVRRFAARGREVWLTIDDGPDERDTPEFLRLLDAAGEKATFFLIGERAEAHPELTREIVARGHEVGNHTWSHPQAWFWALPPCGMWVEIARAQRRLARLTGRVPRVFRSPVGMTNPFVHPVLERLGLRLAGWSDSGVDGLGDRGEEVVRRIMRRLRPGGIVVLHEGGAPGRVETLELLLRRLREEGFRCVIPDAESFRSDV